MAGTDVPTAVCTFDVRRHGVPQKGETKLKLVVIDGQGGGFGRAIIEALRAKGYTRGGRPGHGLKRCTKQERGRKMKRFFLKKAAALAVLLAAAVAMFPAFAEVDITPTSDFYVYDGADVLSESTESDIVSKNDILYNASGAQIVVVTVHGKDRIKAAL